MIEGVAAGFVAALAWPNLLFLFLGTLLGVFAGAMPGLSSSVGLAILLPFTFGLDPTAALLTMVALYMAGQYGGSIAAIAIGVPGTPPAVATTFDGFPMTRRGEAGKALGVSIGASAFGGVFGTVVLMLAFGPLARGALAFGPAEYFALGVFGLSVVANMLGRSPVKGFVSVVVGLLLYVVGLDVLSGYPRFTFGTSALQDGFHLIPTLIGFFAVAEVMKLIGESRKAPGEAWAGGGDGGAAGPGGGDAGISGRLPTRKEWRRLLPSLLRGSTIGTVVGAIPGAGATIASLIAWNEEKRFSSRPEAFGTGILEGIAAPEAANNSSVGAAMIPLLALGIPGSASTAVLLGGLMVHGINPGPLLIVENADLVYTLYAGFLVAVCLMLAIGLLGIPLWIRILSLRTSTLTPLVLGISLVGAFALRQNLFDVWVALGTGVLGFVLLRRGIPLVPAILGLVLGPMVERNYRRALSLSGGDHATFLESPIALVLLVLAAASFVMPAVRRRLLEGRGGGPGAEA